MDHGRCLRWSSLACLTLQNVGLVLLMRFVRTRAEDMFHLSTAVVCAELLKLLASLLILLYSFSFNPKKLLAHLKEAILNDPRDWGFIAVPAVLYVVQNNLVFVAVSNLDAATFQVCYQLKLLTTAVFFRIILKRSQSKLQWISLFLLFLGIVIVQIQHTTSTSTKLYQNRVLGITVVLIGSVISGFAGVFFEKILKGTPKNVWIRNMQLATYGVLFGLITVLFMEGESTLNNGFFYGYDGYVWLVIVIQSIGGLLVAVVVKYADNILKGFATTIAIVLAALMSIPLFHIELTLSFMLGASIVVVATITYSLFPFKHTIKEEAVHKV